MNRDPLDPGSPGSLHGPVPRHIAVIMDGNGRWAAARGLPRRAGHQEGMKAVREVIEGCAEAGVGIVTLFAFSTDNWQRPEEEIHALMGLLRLYAGQEKEELRERGIEVRVLGDLSRLDEATLGSVRAIQRETRGGARMRLNLMVSYSGRADILGAVRAIAAQVREGVLEVADIDGDAFASHLLTRSLPDPDLLIRTSGELRISNFMLWQFAYTEIYTTPVLWPDFTQAELREALVEYQRRERRFGRVPSS